jgi:hypothetical protein
MDYSHKRPPFTSPSYNFFHLAPVEKGAVLLACATLYTLQRHQNCIHTAPREKFVCFYTKRGRKEKGVCVRANFAIA